ncbi:hypothetical protein [Pelotomaculum propionicicum]|uniref:DUF2993 domain-containing protein n=1 Tax=Pelotomaculum propionicicum TaxID=258475 RepID=A0A4Y7RQR0_9FIRM|nr:hypothetical protein [Pelotomaculum propionicicum]NLI12774.1 hypothetical protein [Peptococcaceae bacterium]TEB10597.1 hypothetical protein Pmgp_02287 [Pelotomaculum propionicicum]
MSLLDNIKSLLGGNINVHQEFINKFIGETLAENKVVKEIVLTVGEGCLDARVGLVVGESTPIDVKLELSLGKYEFNRTNRYVELIPLSPVIISVYGVNIRTRLAADLDDAEARRLGAPEGLISMFSYLTINEDKLVLDFNKIPGFSQALQNKLGFVLNNLEITKLELQPETIVIHPSVKFF